MVYRNCKMQFTRTWLTYGKHYHPEYVLILSGDHIYKMDYEVMLDYHKAKPRRCDHRMYAGTDRRSKPFRCHDHRRKRKNYRI